MHNIPAQISSTSIKTDTFDDKPESAAAEKEEKELEEVVK